MGVCYSKMRKNRECFLCMNKLTNEYLKCKNCGIYLHDTCETTYRYITNKEGCPHCQIQNSITFISSLL